MNVLENETIWLWDSEHETFAANAAENVKIRHNLLA